MILVQTILVRFVHTVEVETVGVSLSIHSTYPGNSYIGDTSAENSLQRPISTRRGAEAKMMRPTFVMVEQRSISYNEIKLQHKTQHKPGIATDEMERILRSLCIHNLVGFL